MAHSFVDKYSVMPSLLWHNVPTQLNILCNASSAVDLNLTTALGACRIIDGFPGSSGVDFRIPPWAISPSKIRIELFSFLSVISHEIPSP
jgi:hypothetical protein